MLAKDFFEPGDEQEIIETRRTLHRHPEIRFDLPETLALVRRRLDELKIPYTEEYGRSSIVATINPKCTGYTLGIRADMDALPIHEDSGLPFSSERDGKMHACGHDAHTAMLLGTAKALKRAEHLLTCRVKLLFQPAEEDGSEESGAYYMVEDGVMDEIDAIIGMHIENFLDSGCIGVCPGASMAACAPITLKFHGYSAHATMPHMGHDALAMAVKTYSGIQMMLAREIDPFARYVCSVGSLHAGTAGNIISPDAEMKISLRTYDVELDEFIESRIQLIAKNAAEELGGTMEYKGGIHYYPIHNDPAMSEEVLQAAEKVVGKEHVVPMPPKMSSEDFSQYLRKKPGVFFRLGTRNLEKNCIALPHSSDFRIDEAAFIKGSMTCVQFVFDHMNGK